MRHELFLMTPAQIAIPSAGECFSFIAPFASVLALWWVYHNADRIIERLFPQWEWEMRLSWLNIRAAKQAEAVWRWIGYGVYAMLAAALYGILWGSTCFSEIARTTEPTAVMMGTARLVILLVSLGLWLIYLGGELIPRLRREYEWEELEKSRAEQEGIDEDGTPSRLSSSPINPSTITIWSKAPYRSQQEGPHRH